MYDCIIKDCGDIGLFADNGTHVTAQECEFTNNGIDGRGTNNGIDGRGGAICVRDAKTTAILIDCTVHHNNGAGVFACYEAVTKIYGATTNIYSNEGNGLCAKDGGTINIHLPSQHSTSHGNDGEDRSINGGSIANINADGTFTHVVAEEEDDEH